eukprot:Nk52_evm1s1022 gene=Nk52_evmTU1s1022
MVYTNINMHTPQEHSVGMNAKIDVSNVGPRKTVVGECGVDILAGKDKMGHMKIPSMTVGGEDVSHRDIDSSMTNIVDSVFQAQTKKLMAGNKVSWATNGPVNVQTCAGKARMTYDITMNKPIDIQGEAILDATVPELVLDHGYKSTIYSYVTQTMTSRSIVTVSDFGTMTFALFKKGKKIGESTLKDFFINQGPNTVKNIYSTLTKDGSNDGLISDFFSHNMVGDDFVVQLV